MLCVQVPRALWKLGHSVKAALTLCHVVYAGAQIPLEDVPSVQKEAITRCRQAGKPVIVASHLLQSMIEYPTPTRSAAQETFAWIASTTISPICVQCMITSKLKRRHDVPECMHERHLT